MSYGDIIQALEESEVDASPVTMKVEVPEDQEERASEIVKEEGGKIADSYFHEDSYMIVFTVFE